MTNIVKTTRLSVTTSTAIKSGLKETKLAERASMLSQVTTSAPMKRGLKDYTSSQFSIDSFCNNLYPDEKYL